MARRHSKKTVVAIFAHPDDEAFGPAGTMHKLTKKYDVYLICATKGEAGQGGDGKKVLPKVRAKEIRDSAKILGVRKVYFLGFADGALSNNTYHKLAASLEKHLKRLKPEIILTSDHRGVSGHIDHIVISMVSSYVFERLKFIKKIMYFCASEEMTKAWEKYPYFIYRPPGYKRSEIDEIIDISDVWDIKLAAGAAHKSQADDFQRILDVHKDLPKEEYFLVRKR